jgi:hypothetical protein
MEVNAYFNVGNGAFDSAFPGSEDPSQNDSVLRELFTKWSGVENVTRRTT